MVNGTGAANLAAACAAVQARLVQPSTDYVFAGTSERPYAEDDIPAPRSAYGRTKLAAERAVLGRLPGAGYVVRTAWLYGAHGPSFVRTMINLERQRPTVLAVGVRPAAARRAAPARASGRRHPCRTARFRVGRPGDADVRVERVHAVLSSRRVGGRAQVDDRRLVTERHERVPQPLGEEYRTSAGVVQAHWLPVSVARRADPDVDDHVEDGAADADDVLSLPGRDVGEVNAPNHSPPGHRAVGLHDLRLVAERREQVRGLEPLQETPPGVVEDPGVNVQAPSMPSGYI